MKLNKIEHKIYYQFSKHTCFEIEGTDNEVIYYLHLDECMRIKRGKPTPYDNIITHRFDKPEGYDMLTPGEWEDLECPEYVRMIKDLADIYEEMLKEDK